TDDEICSGQSTTLNATGYVNSLAADFSFAASSGTFTPITGGTSAGINGDDVKSGAIPIGFNFNHFGSSYTQLYASSNGMVSFNPNFTGTAITAANTYTNGFSSTTPPAAMLPMLAPLWDDLNGNVGTATYTTSGIAGNRVFVLEYLNWKWNYQATSAVISFQVKLYEADGKVEFTYRPEAGTVTTASATIGMAGPTSANFISLNGTGTAPSASTSVSTNSLATRPNSGQRYIFSPATPTFTWSPNTGLSSTTGSSVTASNLTSSVTYTVSAGTAGCVSTSVVGITVDALPALTSSQSATGCTGTSNGAIDLSVSGNAPYTYAWSNGATTQDLSGLAQGTYTVTVTDVNGCINSTNQAVAVNPLPVATISGTTTACGSVSLTAAGGSTYLWNGGSSANSAAN
ncbi:MAG: hypothetical protein ACKPAD_05765, partial [Bacteroidota bacterium]